MCIERASEQSIFGEVVYFGTKVYASRDWGVYAPKKQIKYNLRGETFHIWTAVYLAEMWESESHFNGYCYDFARKLKEYTV